MWLNDWWPQCAHWTCPPLLYADSKVPPPFLTSKKLPRIPQRLITSLAKMLFPLLWPRWQRSQYHTCPKEGSTSTQHGLQLQRPNFMAPHSEEQISCPALSVLLYHFKVYILSLSMRAIYTARLWGRNVITLLMWSIKLGHYTSIVAQQISSVLLENNVPILQKLLKLFLLFDLLISLWEKQPQNSWLINVHTGDIFNNEK